MEGKIVDNYVLPEKADVKEISVDMWGNGIHKRAFQDKTSALYDCAIGRICECGKTFEGKMYISCPECRDKRRDEKYNSLELVDWDGKAPLSLFDGDEYFYDEDSIMDYIENEGIEGELQLVLCEQVYPNKFCLDDLVEDHLPEDFRVEDLENKNQKYTASEVEDIVNEYLKTLSPVYYPGNKRVKLRLEDLKNE